MTHPVMFFGEVERRLPEALLLVDGGGVVLDANPAACRAFDRPLERLRDQPLGGLVESDPACVNAFLRSCSASRQLAIGALTVGDGDRVVHYRCDGAVLHPAAEGRRAIVFIRMRPRSSSVSRFRMLNSKVEELASEIATRMRAESLLDGQRHVLELIAAGAPLERTLAELVHVTEQLAPGELRASVLLLDETGRRLCDAAGERLPQAYRQAIDGIEIGPAVGSCGSAAFHNRQVIVADIASDPLWKEYRDLAAQHDLAACWSTPIRARDGSVLGTFALYYSDPRAPEPEDQQVVEIMTRAASIAVERKRVESRVQELLASERSAREEAESANRAKDEFLALVSHELRNPLNAIMGWIRLLQADGLDEPTRAKGIDTIARNAKLQAELIEDVLDFARVTSGRLTLNPQPVLLSSIIEKACESVRPEARARGIALDMKSEPPEDPVSIDPDRLQQAISNVLWNAVKFTPKGGRISVGLDWGDDAGRIRIRDTGCGIDPEFLPHIFERFRQADASRSREHGGLGLGLAVVKHIVELHGGRVEAHSHGPGTGATFTLSIPLAHAAAVVEPGYEPTTGAELAGLHVLAVDDGRDARDLLEVALSRSGARVTTAASADEALEKIRRDRPDVLVCDIGMPGKDGYEFIRAWRAEETLGRLPALALTAYTRDVDRVRAIEAGFDRHAPKPIDPVALVAAVAELIEPRPD